MSQRISARDARARFAELTDRVKYTGEPVIVEKQGRPFIAMIRAEDLERVERLLNEERQAGFSRLAAEAVDSEQQPWGPSDDEIVEAVRLTREALYRERYGAA